MSTTRVLGQGTAVAVLAIMAGCHSKSDEQPTAPPSRAVPVVVPRRTDLERTIELPGTVVAYYQATLLAHVAGYVKEVRFDKGDPVHAGDLIAEIDVPELRAERLAKRAQLEQAGAGLESARVLVAAARAEEEQQRADVARAEALAKLQVSLHERAKALRADRDISEQDLEIAAGKREEAEAQRSLAHAKLAAARARVKQAETDVSVAEANLGAAQAALDQIDATLSYALIRAPFDGVVTERFIDPGALVQRATRSESAQPIVTVASEGRVRVDFAVPEAEVAFVASGSSIELSGPGIPGRRIAGAVTRVARALRPETRTMLGEAEIANEDGVLLPGMYVTVHLVLERHPGTIVVPPLAVHEERGEAFVFVVEGGAARRRRIVKGWDFGHQVEVREGLRETDHVVVGAGSLEDGDRIEPTATPWSPSS